MNNNIKISVVNSECNKLPEAANPFSSVFNPGTTKKYIESNVEKMLAFLHQAGRSGADLVCTYEDFKGDGHYLSYMDDMELFHSLAEEIPGPTSERLGNIAKKYEMHIAANYYEKDKDRLYNASVLIGRDGKMIGRYRKVHLPVAEKWRVAGGKEFPVFETDIGRIGFAICYDMAFTEHCRILALNGADIVVHQTQGQGVNCTSSDSLGEALLRVRAAENSVYLAVSKCTSCGGYGRSCIISNTGEILERLDGGREGIVTAEFAADFDIERKDMFDTFFSGVSSVKARHFLEREPALYGRMADKTSVLLEKYQGRELHLSTEKVKEISGQWTEYRKAVLENRPVSLKYHW